MFDGLIVILEMFYHQPYFHSLCTTPSTNERATKKKNTHTEEDSNDDGDDDEKAATLKSNGTKEGEKFTEKK